MDIFGPLTDGSTFDFAVIDSATGELLHSGYVGSMQMALAQADADAGQQVIVNDRPPTDWCYRRNGEWIDRGPRPTSNHAWSWDDLAWFDARTLDQLKAAKWAEIKAARDAAETAGFLYLGKVIDSDSRSVQRITGAVQAAQAAAAAGQPFAIEWTSADNGVLLLDAAGMMGMPVAMATYANSLHVRARELRAQIDAAATPAALAAIAWPAQ